VDSRLRGNDGAREQRLRWQVDGEVTISELRPSYWTNMQNTPGYKNILGLGSLFTS